MKAGTLLGSRLPLLRETDILVVGGGSAGCTAALAAAEGGRFSVTLIERYGFLGGISTQSLDTFYGFFTPGEEPRKVVGGIPDRIVDRLESAGDMFLRPNTYGAGTGVTYNPERLKLLWDELAAEAGIEVLLHTQIVDVERADERRVRSISVLTPAGFYRISARRYIDTTGDASLTTLLGLPVETAGETEPAQTLTTTFRMCSVDLAAYRAAGGKAMLQQKMAEAVDSGDFPLPRRKGSIHEMVQRGCIATVAVRVAGVDPFDARSLSDGEREGRRQAYLYESFLRARVPGFEEAKIIGTSSPQIGIREARRAYGEYRLTREDCLSVRRFSDCVLLCGAPIEDHRRSEDGEEETEWTYIPNGDAYDVPYRTLIPRGSDDLWVAGRCFSATHGAHASCRSMAQTMAMGQAAGLAAAVSLELDCTAGEVPAEKLQSGLTSIGAVLTVPDSRAFVGRDEWRRNF